MSIIEVLSRGSHLALYSCRNWTLLMIWKLTWIDFNKGWAACKGCWRRAWTCNWNCNVQWDKKCLQPWVDSLDLKVVRPAPWQIFRYPWLHNYAGFSYIMLYTKQGLLGTHLRKFFYVFVYVVSGSDDIEDTCMFPVCVSVYRRRILLLQLSSKAMLWNTEITISCCLSGMFLDRSSYPWNILYPLTLTCIWVIKKCMFVSHTHAWAGPF